MSDCAYKKGEIIVITRGEYSDYRLKDVVRAERDFTLRDVVESFEKVYPNHEDYTEAFMPWLIFMGYVSEVEWREFHTGEYTIEG